jgi:hypothetical protein
MEKRFHHRGHRDHRERRFGFGPGEFAAKSAKDAKKKSEM